MPLTDDELMARWSLKIGRRKHLCSVRRPFAAMGFLTEGDHCDDFIELERLLLVLLFDDPIGRHTPALRLVGYKGSRVPNGVAWGGSANLRFYKDLKLMPAIGARGLRLNEAGQELFQLALQLQSDLHRVDRYLPRSAPRSPQLPRLWAGFKRAEAANLAGEGPEFEALCQKFDMAPEAMFRKFERSIDGLVAFPLEWVSGQLERSLTIFAELSGFPRRQVFQVAVLPDNLCGFDAAAEFDFYHSERRDYFEAQLDTIRLEPSEALSVA